MLDPEFLREVGTMVDGNADEIERVVVLPVLQHLRDEAFHSTAAAGEWRVKKDEPWPLFRRNDRLGLRDAGDSLFLPAARTLNRRSMDLLGCSAGTFGRTTG
jgi:hypothetical protein